jgi:hypothetical protein
MQHVQCMAQGVFRSGPLGMTSGYAENVEPKLELGIGLPSRNPCHACHGSNFKLLVTSIFANGGNFFFSLLFSTY